MNRTRMTFDEWFKKHIPFPLVIFKKYFRRTWDAANLRGYVNGVETEIEMLKYEGIL